MDDFEYVGVVGVGFDALSDSDDGTVADFRLESADEGGKVRSVAA